MGKKSIKGSKPKKDKRDSKSKKGDDNYNTIPKYLQIDPDLLQDLTKGLQDVFRFQNGDVYVGEFSVTDAGGVMRQGRGQYWAADGEALSGRWAQDVLVEAERVTYPDHTWYTGPLDAGRYEGLGTYGVPGLGTLSCRFLHGRPLGLVTLSDKDDQEWQGQAWAGAASLTLLPRNHLFDSEDAWCRAASREKESVKTLKSAGSFVDEEPPRPANDTGEGY